MTQFSMDFRARWGDMDFNAHMRNTAYLEVSEDCRMQYFESRGFTMREFEKRRVGPVVFRDEMQYRRELRLLDNARVDIAAAGLSEDGSRFRLRNVVRRASDDEVAAIVTSDGGWLGLDERKLVPPPDELLAVLRDLPKTDDFEELKTRR